MLASFGDASANHSTAQGAFNAAGWTSYQSLPLPLLFVCEDNGIGIPSDKFSTIFDMFQRLHTRKEYEGTGLGLSICRRIMDLHGGSIAIRSQPGAGSCFTIHLPLSVGLPTDKDTK